MCVLSLFTPQGRSHSRSSSFTQEVETALESFDFLNCSDLDDDEEEEEEDEQKRDEKEKEQEKEDKTRDSADRSAFSSLMYQALTELILPSSVWKVEWYVNLVESGWWIQFV